ncbi:hypothetical protein N9A87_03265 [Euryarchaeota archaeon]|nr:hypothetical protein [Euryarchaeota archaeon]
MELGLVKDHQGLVVWTAKPHGAQLHSALKSLLWLNPQARCGPISEHEVGFACHQVSDLTENEKQALTSMFPHRYEHALRLITGQRASVNPHERLLQAVNIWMAERGITFSKDHQAGLPQKWERLGDLVILNQASFSNDSWQKTLRSEAGSTSDLWEKVARALGGERLAQQAQIMDNALRSPQLKLLHGAATWVEFLDHGVHFGFDAAQVMFSSGNITERHRIGSISMEGETVVDAFAGAGYYTLPMLVRSGAALVHACEMNPASIEALNWASSKNGVGSRLLVHPGDNQTTLPMLTGVADRCHLGLLPSSEGVWQHALACLKPTGGRLHVHMNVPKAEIESWKSNTLKRLRDLAKKIGRQWDIEAEHLERVKSYSPGVIHVVLDVKCSAA